MEISGGETVLANMAFIDASTTEPTVNDVACNEISISTSATAAILPGGVRGNWDKKALLLTASRLAMGFISSWPVRKEALGPLPAGTNRVRKNQKILKESDK
jgi:hypothetical protein